MCMNRSNVNLIKLPCGSWLNQMRRKFAPSLAGGLAVWREDYGWTFTCRTKLLEVVSDDVLPSERLNRLFLLAYFPWEKHKVQRGLERREKHRKVRSTILISELCKRFCLVVFLRKSCICSVGTWQPLTFTKASWRWSDIAIEPLIRPPDSTGENASWSDSGVSRTAFHYLSFFMLWCNLGPCNLIGRPLANGLSGLGRGHTLHYGPSLSRSPWLHNG